jgi:hypothetical protein
MATTQWKLWKAWYSLGVVDEQQPLEVDDSALDDGEVIGDGEANGIDEY